MSDGPRFSTGERRGVSRRVGALSVLLLIVICGFSLTRMIGKSRSQAEDRTENLSEVIVEVRGEVPEPGYYAIEPPLRAHTALQAAGVGELEGVPDAELQPGTRVVFEGRSYRLESMDKPLVIGLPVDLNQASSDTLESIPGIGPSLAQGIVEERGEGGDYRSIEGLERVDGIGPATVEKIRPFVTVEGSP